MHSSFVMMGADLHTAPTLLMKYIRILTLSLGMGLVPVAAAQAADALFDTKAKQALMIEDQTGTILFAKSPDTLIEPAALAKLMTMEVVFHELKAGKISLSTQYTVS